MARNVASTARIKVRGSQDSQELCADCGATEADWASINRGVLVCIDCCSVHRSLGRHVSQIKSRHDKDWHPHTWNLVCALSAGGANSVWEHTLLDPTLAKSAKKKPSPTDPVHPIKADFIRGKHQMMSFVNPPPSSSTHSTTSHNQTSTTSTTSALSSNGGGGGVSCAGGGGDEGEGVGQEGDLGADEGEEAASQELHSSVRTGNLETSLRLLSQGADPNYYHKGRGNYPLHVAASSGQAEQVELLLVYGAVPQCLDTTHSTPAQAASAAGHPELASRLTDVQLELVQRLIRYLSDQYTNTPPHSHPYHTTSNDPAALTSTSSSSRTSSTADAVRPTSPPAVGAPTRHELGLSSSSGNPSGAGGGVMAQFFLPPHLISQHQHATDHARQARAKLIKMPSVLLEELAADLYDEVDRRELEVACCSSTSAGGERCTVPFLPVNPLLSSTRNQARQKLARLKESEFCSLIVDLLVEARRRAAIVAPAAGCSASTASLQGRAPEDDPLYDSVCSEDDYSLLEQLQQQSSGPRQQQGVVKSRTPLEEDYQEVVESPVDEQPFSFAPTASDTKPCKDDLSSFAAPGGGTSPSNLHNGTTNDLSPAISDAIANPCSSLPLIARASAAQEQESLAALVVSSPLSSTQQHLVTSTFASPPSLSPSLSTITQQQQQSESCSTTVGGAVAAVSLEQYERMRHQLESSERTIKELQDDNHHMKSKLHELSSTVNKLRQENSSLRSLASPSPPPLPPTTPSPTYHQPFNSLPPLLNGATSPVFNSSRSFVSMPYHNTSSTSSNNNNCSNNNYHHHQRSDSYPNYSEPSHQHNNHYNQQQQQTSNSSNNNQHHILGSKHFPLPPPPPETPSPQYEYPTRPSPSHFPSLRYSASVPMTGGAAVGAPLTSSLYGAGAGGAAGSGFSRNKAVLSGSTTNNSSASVTGVGSQSAPASASSLMPARPFSMFETREKRAGAGGPGAGTSATERELNTCNLRRAARAPSGFSSNTVSCNTYESISNSSEWDESASAEDPALTGASTAAGASHQHQRSSSFSDELYSRGDSRASSSRHHTPTTTTSTSQGVAAAVAAAGGGPHMPTQTEVVMLTDSITRGIQELLLVAQRVGSEGGQPPYSATQLQQFVACADRIRDGVQAMAAAFPRSQLSMLPSMYDALVRLLQSTVTLSDCCKAGSSTQELIKAAYAIAQATKNLVTCFQ